MKTELIDKLKDVLGTGNVLENEMMRDHSSMQTGGPARLFLTPTDTDGLRDAVRLLNEYDIPWYVIGNATNILFKDSGYDGALIQMLDKQNAVTVDGVTVTAQAGVMLKELARIICEAELTGFEFASGIPGSLGGAVTMNAGAYGGEMKDVVKQVTVMDRTGQIRIFSADETDFSYRHSAFSGGEYIVLSAELELKHGVRNEIQALMDDLNARRKDKQPLEYPSCGSVFKRPEGYFAGKLIMDAGLKGARVGGASVSEKHCGFIINDRQGTTQDVLDLITVVQKEVKERFGVDLECEVKVL